MAGRATGFTLIEVVVALAILAVALAAASRASSMAISDSSGLKERLLAEWVAENRLTEHTARRDWPEVGVSTGEAEQGGVSMGWEERVGPSPNASFRRIEILVHTMSRPDHVAARLVGYLAAPKVVK